MLTPNDEAELADIVSSTKMPLALQGGGTRGMSVTGAAVTTRELSGIKLYEAGALTLVAEAGTPMRDVEAALAAENQRLAFEPMDYRRLLNSDGEPTIGGVVAANVSGPRRIAVGACRDFMLGVRYIDGNGVIIKNGGRVMKNVTGYDLVKLMVGARGTLGVLTEISLKVLPRPETEATIIIHGLDHRAAVSAMAKSLGSPYEVTGAASLPKSKMTIVRIEGFEISVQYRAQKLKELLVEFGEVTVTANAKESREIWCKVRDVEPFHGADGDVWRLSIKPSDSPELVSRLNAYDVIFDWGGGLIWLLVPSGLDVREKIGDIAGHATLLRASSDTMERLGMFQPEEPAVAALSKGLREKFDPRGIFNAGLMAAA
ncbi:MAG: FAD-binding protein [Aestuariivita sp.]|nr:FAD-binding protein [Aestuariivita sp.]MCY4201424.1 FAD-binding protein [Aestuariivita sp.]MCY4290024.1 FAD-binding protein [Aestuariivita sp.]MCY4346864.1 FAD-binding protein [Aestuariivita sp.]